MRQQEVQRLGQSCLAAQTAQQRSDLELRDRYPTGFHDSMFPKSQDINKDNKTITITFNAVKHYMQNIQMRQWSFHQVELIFFIFLKIGCFKNCT